MIPNDCESLRGTLTEYALLGSLAKISQERRVQVVAHVKECPTCKAHIQSLGVALETLENASTDAPRLAGPLEDGKKIGASRPDTGQRAPAELLRLEKELAAISKQPSDPMQWERSFSDYVRFRENDLLRMAMNITGCFHAAQDAVQDGFIALYQHLEETRSDTSIGAWLTTVVVNNALQHLRGRKVHRTVSLESQQEEMVNATEEAPSERREALSSAWSRISLLPKKERTVLVLRILHGLSYPEIAKVLCIKPNTAKRCYYKAVERARERD